MIFGSAGQRYLRYRSRCATSTIFVAPHSIFTTLEELESELGRIVEGGAVGAEGGAWSANQRQAEALEQALGALERLEAIVVDGNLPVDFWTIDLREAAMALGAVTGEDVSEDVLDVVFTKFCIGK